MTEINTHAGNVRLVGGRLCLDFVNTVDDHALASPKEYLADYAALVAWGCHAGALSEGDAAALLGERALRPRVAEEVLARARGLRAALFRIFSATSAGRAVAAGDLAALNDALAGAPRRWRLAQLRARLAWQWDECGEPLDQPLWPVVWSAADLLTAPEVALVRACAGEGCGWLFVDASRNHTRRWCSMEDCGNRAKARRHYAARKAEGG
ncbi:MAG: ABATE domain-containing protein [Kouleothrix sp.]|nr:ABATE domain-containing protein [Kouleothrix sp.]